MDTYSGDKGYDDGNNHYYLERNGLHSAIRLKKTRTSKKNDNASGLFKQSLSGLSGFVTLSQIGKNSLDELVGAKNFQT
ncbi:MAG: hypothetical protein A2X26_13815 [Chloroflexi bacterium GWC2_49_37]|nr:MAG: hypothetical protein A2X26_13815 [Chloroflexi bacterium GWC2_49_37]